MPKPGKRYCKNCGTQFQKEKPLQFVCSLECSIEYDQKQKDKKVTKLSRSNKYNSKKQTYNGYSYDSILEANYAKELDWLIKANLVKSWERQKKIELIVNGVHVGNYYVDFVVYYPEGHYEFHEVKGFETPLWRLKWKIAQAMFPDNKFVLIK